MIKEFANKSFKVIFNDKLTGYIESPIFANTPSGRCYASDWLETVITNDNGIGEWKTHIFGAFDEYYRDIEDGLSYLI
jgi:hypothetical protein